MASEEKSELVLWAETVARPLPIAAGLIGGIIIYATYPDPVFPRENFQLVKDFSALGAGLLTYFMCWLGEAAVHSYFSSVKSDLDELENIQKQFHEDIRRQLPFFRLDEKSWRCHNVIMAETAPTDRIPGAEYHTVPDDRVYQVKNEALKRGIAATMEFPDEDADGKPKEGFTTVVFLPRPLKPDVKP